MAKERPPRPNHSLRHLIDQAGWTAESLAVRVNAALTAHADRRPIHLKTPYGWLGNGDVPRSPVDRIVVELLAEALGRPLSYRDAWLREPREPTAATPATSGLDVAWTPDGMPRLLKEWSMLDRREFTAGWGVALLHAAGNALQTQPGGPGTAPAPADDELLRLVDDIVTRSRALDDHHGSAAATFVGDQFAIVARLAGTVETPPHIRRHLYAALAQLAQTAGFMAHEQAREGDAQYWYLSGLRAAHAAHEPHLAASILALMSNQATTCGRHRPALQLASVAHELTRDAVPPVRALITARSCLAYAGAGDYTGFRRAHDESLEATADTTRGRPAPTWMSYVDATELDAIGGRGYLLLADTTVHPARPLLNRARELLAGRVTDAVGHERSAVRHATLQALACATAGDLDHATAAARVALRHAPDITSVHCTRLLQRLGATLHDHRTAAPVRELLDERPAFTTRSTP
ncbi:hypothetical protein [Embleya sp. MST-111070]|uniref:hypothetical protein n=1 Tax=Embleya sp. MST-111070 TaxID=3398231 RepID=UPI003F73FB54